MPYKIRRMGGGMAKVVSPNHPSGFSKKKMTLSNARAQLKAIMMSTKGK